MVKLRHLPAALLLILLSGALLTGCAQEYEVSLDAEPEEAGEVTGTGVYQEGEMVEVAAEPGKGYVFEKWVKDGEEVRSDERYRFKIEEDKNLQAEFAKKEYEIEVEINDEEKGKVTGAGSYEHGETSDVTAESKECILFDYIFEGWTKNGEEVRTDKSYEFEVKKDAVLTAHFGKRVADESLDPIILEELEQMSLEEVGEKVEEGVLKLDTIFEDEKSLLPSTAALTHINVDGNLIELEELLFMRDLEDSAPNLVNQVDAEYIKYYFGNNMLFSNEDIRIALEKNWDEIICPYFAEWAEEQNITITWEQKVTRVMSAMRDLSLYPGENKMAIGMDNMGCAFRMGATGIFDMENNDLYFTNISKGFHSNLNWSPNSEHVAYSSSRKVESYLYVDNVTEKRNVYILTPEKLNSVLEQEGMKTLCDKESLLIFFEELTWTEDGQTLYFVTDMKKVNWEEGNESEIKAIEWKLNLQTGDISKENVKK